MPSCFSVSSGQTTSQYQFVYDGLSRLRISRYYVRVNGQLALQNETRRVYDGMDVVQERDQNNVVTASYTRTGNIGGLLARTSSSGSVFYGYDGGGNVTTLTNRNDVVVGSYTYDAWGNTVASSGSAASENPYRFSTKEQFGGLYSYGFRFYSPGLGRWINRDPIGEAGGSNLYGFVGNNPVNMVDTNGMIGAAVEVTLFHRDFTLHTPGYGHFGGDLLFDKGSAQNLGGDLSKGWYAGADGLNPFGSPYKDIGYYSPCDKDAITSFRLGKVSQLSFAAAGGAYAAQAGWLYNPAMGSAGDIASNIATSASTNVLGGVAHRGVDRYLLGKDVNPLDRQGIAEDALSGALGGYAGLRAIPAGQTASSITGGAAGYGFGDYLYQGVTGWTP